MPVLQLFKKVSSCLVYSLASKAPCPWFIDLSKETGKSKDIVVGPVVIHTINNKKVLQYVLDEGFILKC